MMKRSIALTVSAAAWAFGCQSPAQPQTPQGTGVESVSAPASREAATAPPATDAAAPATEPPVARNVSWWDQPYPEKFDGTQLPNQLAFVSVQGNRFVNEAGDTVIFQGVSIADPDKLLREGHWSPKVFEAIASWGANVVRVPVHPGAWRGAGREAYLRLLDQAVLWANQQNLYLIIDWHSIGNLKTELFQHPMYVTTKQETYEFWRAISFRYQGVSTVAMYELFNEPTVYNGNLGTISWDEWKTMNEEMISIIYSHDKKVIPLVAGFDWAFDLSPIAKNPVDREGIAYVSHPYPMKVERPYEKKWDETFGYVAKKYPLITTELGYMQEGGKGAHIPVIDDGTYGPLITDYLAKKGASWVAWCYHPDWPPQLIADWSFTPTESGEHFRKVMLERKGKEAKAVAPGKPAKPPAKPIERKPVPRPMVPRAAAPASNP